jgi:hypothetical protein
MQMTLSLNRRTHLFVKDGKLFFKLYKQSNFTDKKDFAVLSDVPIEQAEAIHKWLGEVIDATKKGHLRHIMKMVENCLKEKDDADDDQKR